MKTNLHRTAISKWLSAAVLVFLTLPASGQSTNCTPRPPGIVAWWPAEDSVANLLAVLANSDALRLLQ